MRRVWMGICSAVLALVLTSVPMPAQSVPDPGEDGTYAVASYEITTTNPQTGSTLDTVIYYPSADGGVDPTGAPHAAIVFAHGFLASPSSYPGNAEHLASWGYVVALPDLPEDDTEVRQWDARHILTYLDGANDDPSSPLFGMVDTGRMGVTGHSLGGLTAMIVAARDGRVRAAVALDPVNPDPIIGADPWDYATEAPNTIAPLLVLGAPSQTCNASANYNPMYGAVGAAHRAKLVVTDASHCDFMVTDSDLHVFGCTLFCGGTYDEERVTLVERYATAWFNYYLRGEAGYYRYIHGDEAADDVSTGRISERDAYTNTEGASALPEAGGIRVRWTPCDYAPIAGYNVYRATQSAQYGAQPYAQVGRQGSYLDGGATAGQRFYYVVRSRDAGGNEHGQSSEVSAVLSQDVTPTTTQEPPVSPTPTLEPPTSPTATAEPGVTPTATPRPPSDNARTYLPILSH